MHRDTAMQLLVRRDIGMEFLVHRDTHRLAVYLAL